MKEYIPYIILVIVILFCTNFVLDEIKDFSKENSLIQSENNCLHSAKETLKTEVIAVLENGKCYATALTEIKIP